MLDVACGKGRHSIQLANKGFDVTGIDLSDDSINEALSYRRQIRFIFTNMICVCLFGSITLIMLLIFLPALDILKPGVNMIMPYAPLPNP